MERKLSEQEIVRREKLKGIERPYPDHFNTTHTIKEARELKDGTKNVYIAGRIGFMRKLGKLSFIKIRNLEEAIQLQISEDIIGAEKYETMKKIFDSGDFIGATGEIITTQTGEKSLQVEDFVFLGKSLRPLPEKFHGLQDTELKYRERYVDLIMNQDSRDIFLGRSKFYYFLRKFMFENKFLEVETPIVQTAVSGASAKPFFTHHNALNIDCNLRIAPECYLKECNAGGFERVYEVAKCFRNEGMDPQHLQEFTQIEWYASFWNFEDNIRFFQEFMRETAMYLKGTTVLTIGDKEIDLGAEWNRVNYCETLTEKLGFDFLSIEDPEEFRTKLIENKLFTKDDLIECSSVAQLIDYAYKRLIRVNIFEPTIMWNYPAVLKPLARQNDDDNRVVDVFQVIIAGSEICNAYSELVNPEIQRANFEEQLKQKAQGDDETMDLDEDYLKAMEQGMPPISGLGVGIDRLMMLLYNAASVRDVVLFPMMRPENAPKTSSNNSSNTKTIDFSKVVIEPLFEDQVDFETFSKSDFRAVKILACEAVPKSSKLLQFTLNDGTGENRTILSGIHAFYEPEDLVGKTCIAITNLPPRTMMGIDSCGMLLSAVHSEDGVEKLHLLLVDDEIPAGAKLY